MRHALHARAQGRETWRTPIAAAPLFIARAVRGVYRLGRSPGLRALRVHARTAGCDAFPVGFALALSSLRKRAFNQWLLSQPMPDHSGATAADSHGTSLESRRGAPTFGAASGWNPKQRPESTPGAPPVKAGVLRVHGRLLCIITCFRTLGAERAIGPVRRCGWSAGRPRRYCRSPQAIGPTQRSAPSVGKSGPIR